MNPLYAKRNGKNRGGSNSRVQLLPLIMVLMLAFISFMPHTATGAAAVQILVDGQEIDYGDAPPMVLNNRTCVGIRSLALALGVPESGIQWNGADQSVTLAKGDTTVILVMDSQTMQVNSEKVPMDVALTAINNRTYLPVRYVAEAFGFTVEWNENSQQALITSNILPESSEDSSEVVTGATMSLSSPSFANEGIIPVDYVAKLAGGMNLSPEISWTNAPAETKSLAVLMYDIDAGNWLHWAVINIPPEVTKLPETTSGEELPAGCIQLFNETDKTPSYCGPSPPAGSGIHHYVITVYALDTENLPPANGFESFSSLTGRLEPHTITRADYQGICSR